MFNWFVNLFLGGASYETHDPTQREPGADRYDPGATSSDARDGWETDSATLPAWGAGARFNGNSRPAINWDAVDEFGIDCSKLGKERGINYDALVDDWRGRP